jgi:hypothetical protein
MILFPALRPMKFDTSQTAAQGSVIKCLPSNNITAKPRLAPHRSTHITEVAIWTLRATRVSIYRGHCAAIDVDLALIDFFLQEANLGIARVFIDVDEP